MTQLDSWPEGIPGGRPAKTGGAPQPSLLWILAALVVLCAFAGFAVLVHGDDLPLLMALLGVGTLLCAAALRQATVPLVEHAAAFEARAVSVPATVTDVEVRARVLNVPGQATLRFTEPGGTEREVRMHGAYTRRLSLRSILLPWERAELTRRLVAGETLTVRYDPLDLTQFTPEDADLGAAGFMTSFALLFAVIGGVFLAGAALIALSEA